MCILLRVRRMRDERIEIEIEIMKGKKEKRKRGEGLGWVGLEGDLMG